MTTPIFDFVQAYAQSNSSRLHMPAHKGNGALGCESLDITEINGADILSHPSGIILESENNASELFGSAHSFYSTEGSSLCVKAMLMLVTGGKKKKILAARNAHRAFVFGCALLGLEVEWLYPEENEHICACELSPERIRDSLESSRDIAAVYLTSPDYLGNIANISKISSVCDDFNVPLIVDNAHGAYLKFLETSMHPLDLGATICCDSAHKTLPVLTGGAYLHIAKKGEKYLSRARTAMSVFASTSPSYLILQSLDLCNQRLSEGYAEALRKCAKKVALIKNELTLRGFDCVGEEPMKLTLSALRLGYTGYELAHLLRKSGIEPEFCDESFAVLMPSPENTNDDLQKLLIALSLNKKAPLTYSSPALPRGVTSSMSIRDAALSVSENVKVEQSIGRICAAPTVSCPPAIPIAVSGEIITPEAARLMLSYGIEYVDVVSI